MLPNYGNQKATDLKTGEFTFAVLEKGVTERQQPSAEELKNHIAWGKPGTNGLQMGVVLVPRTSSGGTEEMTRHINPNVNNVHLVRHSRLMP